MGGMDRAGGSQKGWPTDPLAKAAQKFLERLLQKNFANHSLDTLAGKKGSIASVRIYRIFWGQRIKKVVPFIPHLQFQEAT